MLLIVIMNPCVRCICVRLRSGMNDHQMRSFEMKFPQLATYEELPSRGFPPHSAARLLGEVRGRGGAPRARRAARAHGTRNLSKP